MLDSLEHFLCCCFIGGFWVGGLMFSISKAMHVATRTANIPYKDIVVLDFCIYLDFEKVKCCIIYQRP